MSYVKTGNHLLDRCAEVARQLSRKYEECGSYLLFKRAMVYDVVMRLREGKRMPNGIVYQFIRESLPPDLLPHTLGPEPGSSQDRPPTVYGNKRRTKQS